MLPTKDPAFHFQPNQRHHLHHHLHHHRHHSINGTTTTTLNSDNITNNNNNTIKKRRKHSPQEPAIDHTDIDNKIAANESENDDEISSCCSSSSAHLKQTMLTTINGKPILTDSDGNVVARSFPLDPPLPWSVFSKLRRSWNGDDDESDDDEEKNDAADEEFGQERKHHSNTSSRLSSSSLLLSASQHEQVTKAMVKIKTEKDEAKREFWLNMSLPAVSIGILDKYCPDLKQIPSLRNSGGNTAIAGSRFTDNKMSDPPTVTATATATTPAPAASNDDDVFSNLVSFLDQEYEKQQTRELLHQRLQEPSDGTSTLLSTPASSTANYVGATFQILAVLTGNTPLLQHCLESGLCNPNDQRFLMDSRPPEQQPRHFVRNGYTPLFVACICEQLACMEMLFQHGASLHTSDRWGRSALHAAAALGNKSTVDWLLAHGAPRLVTDRDAFRPGETTMASVSSSSANSRQPLSIRSTAAAIVVPPRDPRFAHILLRPRFHHHQGVTSDDPQRDSTTTLVQPLPCPCGSGRVCGSCGCVDDSHEKWYLDRVGTRWISRDISTAMSEAQSSVLSLCLPNFIFGSYYQHQQQQKSQEQDERQQGNQRTDNK